MSNSTKVPTHEEFNEMVRKATLLSILKFKEWTREKRGEMTRKVDDYLKSIGYEGLPDLEEREELRYKTEKLPVIERMKARGYLMQERERYLHEEIEKLVEEYVPKMFEKITPEVTKLDKYTPANLKATRTLGEFLTQEGATHSLDFIQNKIIEAVDEKEENAGLLFTIWFGGGLSVSEYGFDRLIELIGPERLGKKILSTLKRYGPIKKEK